MKRSKLMGTAALLLLCLAAPLFAVDADATLIDAARKGDTATVRSLIRAGANVNAQNYNGRTALILAAENGHLDIVKLLINTGVNDADAALIVAAADGGL